ncbi:nicotinamide riboside transporter PnuC [Helcobacillus massiliensis]|uniref:Nicotinamide mononucleotide transporter n=1 Tax=Helcobacillus massiliensis TaxID=521392 RepID=A0A839R1K0_9MICO|nr:nicotinamide riboside transporter PnuC [Helcobacillus massiliensis]MBB3022436.1 nicotinamide mononucleotide transporter [Helcobacillus massiliensis]MCT1557072.1 nicotinamide riboside transporter PnuC [Helcobacillus massiliensis]MCT2035461.1 nicotinamide riboside transporter PnuC [Helcobacillus massiliensis]MCT2331324.1 nicotinamide riboside transporter PnuC [Helcobacillus massiliensis]
MDLLRWLFDAQITFPGGQFILFREVIGNAFGLLSAFAGMRRRVWAWPVGIAGNMLLLTVFLGAVFGSPNPVNLLGQACRQAMFLIAAIYGWSQWRATKIAHGEAVAPDWASWRTRLALVLTWAAGVAVLTPVFRALGSYEPVWADAYIFMGSLLATYGMAKGWVEFWLIWVAVDVVGVPLLWSAGYFASAFMYVFYGAFTLVGFFVWWRIRHRRDRVDTLST